MQDLQYNIEIIEINKQIETETVTLNSETEKDIALTLLELPNVLDRSLNTKTLNELAEYLYKLTSLYNKFYAENKVLAEENQQLQESWLVLTKLVYDINMLLLDVLGLKVPEKM